MTARITVFLFILLVIGGCSEKETESACTRKLDALNIQKMPISRLEKSSLVYQVPGDPSKWAETASAESRIVFNSDGTFEFYFPVDCKEWRNSFPLCDAQAKDSGGRILQASGNYAFSHQRMDVVQSNGWTGKETINTLQGELHMTIQQSNAPEWTSFSGSYRIECTWDFPSLRKMVWIKVQSAQYTLDVNFSKY